MPWFNVDDGFAFHRKVVAAGNAAIGLWTRAGAWSAGELTEGFIPDHMVTTMGTLPQARKLVAVGLWIKVEGGFQFHEWSEDGRNPTRAQVLERRKKDREKKARARAAKQNKTGESAKQPVNGSRPQGTPEGHNEGHPEGVPEGVRSTTPLPSTPYDSLRESPPTGLGTQPTDRASARDRAAALSGNGHSLAAHNLVETFAATCRKRPPAQVRNELAVQVDDLLAEDWTPAEIHQALLAWGAKGLDPRKLQSVANEIANRSPAGQPPRPSTTDQRVAAVLALARPEPDGPHELPQLPGAAS